MSVQQFSVDKAMASEKFKELRKIAYAKVWDGYSQQDAWLLWNVLDVLMENHDGLTWMDREKEEALALVKSTAKGALVASERDKNAMKKAMEAIGLLNSMVAGGEEHSEKSREVVEGAVVALLHAMQFKAQDSNNGASLGAIPSPSSL